MLHSVLWFLQVFEEKFVLTFRRRKDTVWFHDGPFSANIQHRSVWVIHFRCWLVVQTFSLQQVVFNCNTPFTRYNRLSIRLYNRFDNTGLTTGCIVLTNIQPVVKPVVKRVWQPVWQPCWTNSHCSFNRLSNRVVQPVWQTRFDNRVERTAVRSTGCQTGNRLSNRDVQPVWQRAVYTIHRLSIRLSTGLTNGLTTGCIV